jgi:hypothetical protein
MNAAIANIDAAVGEVGKRIAKQRRGGFGKSRSLSIGLSIPIDRF